MSSVRELHDEAARLAQLALVARHNGEQERAAALARQAYQYESQAAALIPDDESSEPTRSILYLSASSLAYQCKEFEAAQRLIAKGLSGYPPAKVEQDLKGLYEQVNFEYHLQARGIILEDEELQLSMQGKAVGSGIILYVEFKKRIDRVLMLVDRTVQRKMNRSYQTGGRIAGLYRPFVPALSAPREGSFAITLKLGRVEEQQLPLGVDAAQIIDEVLAGIEFLNDSDEEGLRGLIQEEAYFNNFVSLARDMAPDGERVSFVGFTSKSRAIGLTRRHQDIELVLKPEAIEAAVELSPITVEGQIDEATHRRQDRIGIKADDGTEYDILVQERLDDLARSYFGQRVIITGNYDGKKIYLADIRSSEE